MKFIVLCSYELQNASEGHRLRVESELADAGFKPVGFERTEQGLSFGLPAAAIGEFRAPGAEVLRERLHRDLDLRLRLKGLKVVFSLLIQPLEGLGNAKLAGNS